jgi:twitching motility two-component system response regulator PilG
MGHVNTALNNGIDRPSAEDSGQDGRAMRLHVRGLRDTERALLASVVRLSQRDTRNRSQPLEIIGPDQARDADVLLVDTRDAEAMVWARQQPWLNEMPVIWLDAANVPDMHMTARRPLQWPVLPVLLARAIDHFAHQPQLAQQASSPATGSTAGATRILIVDDSEVVRSQLRALLGRQGFSIVEAVDVPSALEAASAGSIDCVFMDVVMPGVDGYEGCREIKKLQRQKVVPVVMLTSKSSPFDRIRGRMAGCDAYLGKPVNDQDLKQVLARVLNTQRDRMPAGGVMTVVAAT